MSSKERNQVKLENMGSLRRLALSLITKVQRFLLKKDTDLATTIYLKLASLHFSLYFEGTKSLSEETLNNTGAAYAAAKRHSRMVISTLYSDSHPIRKRMVRAASKGSFLKNIILNELA